MKMSQFISITLVIILGMFLNTCGQMTYEDEGMGSKSIEEASGTTTTTTDNTTTTDTTAPTVSSITPADNSSYYPTIATISIVFSESIDTSSVSTNTSNSTCSGTIYLSSDNFSSCVQMSSSPTASNSSKTFSLTPSSNLDNNTSYKIRITTGIKDNAGNALNSQYTSSNGFTTSSGISIDSRDLRE